MEDSKDLLKNNFVAITTSLPKRRQLTAWMTNKS